MTFIRKVYLPVILPILVLCIFPQLVHSERSNVLVVMSYSQENPWSQEIRKGIDSVLADHSEVTYFHMDTKIDIEGGERKAQQAYELFRKLEPDGVIAADDNAQRLFVVPYLKGEVEVPVMFCGVNAEPEKYGYPASNVSGILERGHVLESLALARQLVPSIESVGFFVRDSPTGHAIMEQVSRESASYPVEAAAFNLVSRVDDLVSAVKALNSRVDALYVDNLQGLLDKKGNALEVKDVMGILTSAFDKPIIGANQYHVEQGALCAVVKTGQEQGKTAATMLLKAMQGTAVAEIPIERNYKGKRFINVTTMSALKVTPRPVVLLGAELIRTPNGNNLELRP